MKNLNTTKKQSRTRGLGLAYNIHHLAFKGIKISVLILMAFLMSGCFNCIMDDDYTSIDSELKPYVDSFLSEAEKRGMHFDVHALKVNFGNLHGEAQGRTYYHLDMIVIDSTSSSWRVESLREALVYHELGHLLLNRGHDEHFYECKPFNIYKSIMSGKGDPYYGGEYSYRREYYINELFNPKEERPSWIDTEIQQYYGE